MNAATRILIQGSVFRGDLSKLFLRTDSIVFMMLAFLTLTSAFGVIYVKDWGRRLHSQLELAQQANERLRIEQGQLLLEQSTLVMQSRVQEVATQQLGMVASAPARVVVVKP